MAKYLRLLVVVALIVGVMAVSVTAQDVAREDTVIFDIDGNVGSPNNYNYFIPGSSRNQGMHQSVWEPLFILNYENGEIQPWLGESMTSNDDFTVLDPESP